MTNVKAKLSGSELSGNPTSKGAAGGETPEAPSKTMSKQLEQELKSLGGMGEDLADILSANWQNLIIFLVGGIVAIAIFHGFGDVSRQNREETAKQFQDAQASFASLEKIAEKKAEPAPEAVKVEATKDESAKTEDKKTEEKKDEVTAKSAEEEKDKLTEEHNEKAAEGFRETIGVLANSQGSSGYGLLASLYKAEGHVTERQYSDARALLENIFGVKAFISSNAARGDTLSAETISLDLATLVYARSFIAEAGEKQDQMKDMLSQGVAAAKAVAERGVFGNVEALVLLSRLGEDVFSAEELQNLAKKVVADHPEMRPQVEKDLPQIKL